MQSDLPHTLYKERKKTTGKGAPASAPVRASDPAFAKQREAYERALARKKAVAEQDAPQTLDELFRQ